MTKAKRRTGLHPLSYMGVEPVSPPLVVIDTRQPNINDSKNFNIGSLWLIKVPNEVWMLVNLAGNIATWVQLYPGAGGGAGSFPCDVGIANEAGGVLNVFGDTHVSTFGSGNTVQFDLDNGANGQVLIGGGMESSWENITSTGGTLTITNGANSLNIETFAQAIYTVECDIGGSITPDASGLVRMFGDSLAYTEGVPAANRIEIHIENGTDGQLLIGETGGGTPLWADLTSTGGSITISPGANALNIETAGIGPEASFMGVQSVATSRVIGVNSVPAWLGEGGVITEIFDTAAAFYGGDGVGTNAAFTAPVTGKYQFNVMLSILRPQNTSIGQDPTMIIQTSNRTYKMRPQIALVSNTEGGGTACICCDMDLGDTAEWGYQVVYGTSPGTRLVGLSVGAYYTSVSGFLVG